MAQLNLCLNCLLLLHPESSRREIIFPSIPSLRVLWNLEVDKTSWIICFSSTDNGIFPSWGWSDKQELHSPVPVELNLVVKTCLSVPAFVVDFLTWLTGLQRAVTYIPEELPTLHEKYLESKQGYLIAPFCWEDVGKKIPTLLPRSRKTTPDLGSKPLWIYIHCNEKLITLFSLYSHSNLPFQWHTN